CYLPSFPLVAILRLYSGARYQPHFLHFSQCYRHRSSLPPQSRLSTATLETGYSATVLPHPPAFPCHPLLHYHPHRHSHRSSTEVWSYSMMLRGPAKGGRQDTLRIRYNFEGSGDESEGE